MRTITTITIALALTGLSSCKGKDKPADPTPGSASGSAGSAPTKPADPPAASSAVKLAPGEPKPGCFAWSASEKAVACVHGRKDVNGSVYTLAFVGGAGSGVRLDDKITDEAAKTVNEALVKGNYAPLAGDAMKIEAAKAVEVGKVALTLTRKDVHKGGENQPPTERHTLVAKCGGADVTIWDDKDEGLSLEVTARAIGDGHLLVEVAASIGREGEYFTDYASKLLDAKSCEVTPPEPAK